MAQDPKNPPTTAPSREDINSADKGWKSAGDAYPGVYINTLSFDNPLRSEVDRKRLRARMEQRFKTEMKKLDD